MVVATTIIAATRSGITTVIAASRFGIATGAGAAAVALSAATTAAFALGVSRHRPDLGHGVKTELIGSGPCRATGTGKW
jgi:hypothetical protein